MDNNYGLSKTGFTTINEFTINNKKQPISLGCFFFHKWSNWSTHRRARTRINNITNQQVDFWEEIQERICLKCGKIQRKILD
jgi:hypothetical protein